MFSFFRYKLLITLFIANNVFAQFDKLLNYNVKDGLAGSEMYCVIQDSKGFIWSGGDMGISRFNGYEFKNFTTENGLPDNTIFGIYEDKKERVWFRTISGRLSFFLNEKINALPCNDTIEKLLRGHFITSIYVDSKDTIWLGTTNNFFIKIKPGWKISDLEKIYLDHNIYVLDIDKNACIFGGSYLGCNVISCYNKNLHKLFSIDPKIKNFRGLQARIYLIRLHDGTYLASVDNKIINFNLTGIIKIKEENSVIIQLLEDSHHSILVGTYNGISIYKDKTFEIPRIIKELDNKIVTGLYQDKEDGLWITTEGHGQYYIPHRNLFYYTLQNGISESKISCMGVYNYSVVTGHLDGSINFLDENSVNIISCNAKTIYNTQTSRLTSIANVGNKTIATTIKNTSYLSERGLKDIPELKNYGSRKMIKSNDGNIWALSFGEIVKYNVKDNYNVLDKCTLKSRANNIFEDKENNLWISAIDGIYIYKDKMLNYLGATNEFFKLRASDVSEANDKSIWIATRVEGVVVKRKNEIDHITEKNGLAGNMCRSLFVDSNIIWVGTNKGLSKITISSNGKYTIDNIYAKNGLLTNEVNTILKHNNKLWLAHNNGVSVFDMATIKPNKYAPPVYIEQIFVNDSLRKKEELANLTYDQNYLTINYIGLTYKDAGKVEYKYKIEGIDSNWIYTNYTTVNFHTVPPGSYKFLVYAKNNDGYWSSTPATVYFTILQPWWQAWQFIVFAIGIIFIIIIILFKYRLNIIKKGERLKNMQQTKVSNAELKALRAQMNPHFVFNAINSVQYFITNNDPASSQKYLSKFAKLIRYVVDNSKPSAIPLNKELEALNLYLDLESLRFENKFEYTIDVDTNVDIENVQIPSMLIQPYVENAIWHGLMHKNSKGKIKIEIKIKENVLICVIEDNGIGRKRSQQIIKEKNNEFHKSVGMSITKERLDVINQQNKSNLTVFITDILDADGSVTGTRVELKLPFQ